MTSKQRAFVREYLLDRNATQSAIRAGYSSRTARSQGHRLLTNADISKEIEKLNLEAEKRLQVTRDQILQELASIGFMNLKDFFEWDAHGIRLKPIEQIPPRALPAIRALNFRENTVSLAMSDKIRALQLLGEHFGLFEGRGEPKQEQRAIRDKAVAERLARLREKYLKAGK